MPTSTSGDFDDDEFADLDSVAVIPTQPPPARTPLAHGTARYGAAPPDATRPPCFPSCACFHAELVEGLSHLDLLGTNVDEDVTLAPFDDHDAAGRPAFQWPPPPPPLGQALPLPPPPPPLAAAAASPPDAHPVDHDGEGLQDKEGGVEVNLQDLDNPDMFGWLNKYSGPLSAKRAWKRRYCVLKGETRSNFGGGV